LRINLRRPAVVAAGIALAVVAVTFAGGWTANATVRIPGDTYAQNGAYQFATSSGTVSASNEISNAPLDYADAGQSLGANGVNLYSTGGAGSDAGIIVPLGRLRSLFNADGKFVPPVIKGHNLEGYNLYFDTNGSDTYLGFPGGNAVYLDKGAGDTPAYDGTNKAAMGAINNPNDAASFDTVWAGQNPTVIPAGTGTITMEQVKADFAHNPDGDTNPLVWAWIGVGDGVTGPHGYVTSVDGVALVNTVTPPPACTGITGNSQANSTAPTGLAAKVDAAAPSREDISWDMPCDTKGAAWFTSIYRNGHLMDSKVTTTNSEFYGVLVNGAAYTMTVRWNDPNSPTSSVTFTAS
jgi:hypothetical protein